jgi:hypothetical protein
MTITTQLTSAQTVALNKAVKANTASLRHNGETTEHSGSVAVVIDYSFKMSKDEEYTPTIALPYKAVLALLAEQSEDMAQAVINAMNEALTLKASAESGDENAESKLKKLMKDAPTATANIDDKLATLPKLTRQGKIHAVEVEVLALNSEVAKTAIADYATKQAENAQIEANMLKAMFA